jgi:hypothetical protein
MTPRQTGTVAWIWPVAAAWVPPGWDQGSGLRQPARRTERRAGEQFSS